MNEIKIDQRQVLGLHNEIAQNPKNQTQPSFKDTMKSVLNEINDLQFDAKNSVTKFLNGEIKDVHQVMIAAEKAGVGLEMTIEVRNKLIEAYREVMRMSG